MENLKRMAFEILVTLVITALFLTHAYELAPRVTQLILLKINLISMGILHAHIAGKLIFKVKLDWTIPWKSASMAHVVRGLLYYAVPYFYSISG